MRLARSLRTPCSEAPRAPRSAPRSAPRAAPLAMDAIYRGRMAEEHPQCAPRYSRFTTPSGSRAVQTRVPRGPVARTTASGSASSATRPQRRPCRACCTSIRSLLHLHRRSTRFSTLDHEGTRNHRDHSGFDGGKYGSAAHPSRHTRAPHAPSWIERSRDVGHRVRLRASTTSSSHL